jgi:hypothetical protein
MRVVRDLRSALRVVGRRGYIRTALRPPGLPAAGPRSRCTAGGVVSGPRGARGFALNLVRSEILTGAYVTPARLELALDRLLAAAF